MSSTWIAQLSTVLKQAEYPDLLSFRFEHDNILMWPFIRYPLLTELADKPFAFSYPPKKNLILNPIKVLPYLKETLFNNPFVHNRNSKTDIVFLSSGIVNIELANKSYFNRLYDDFALEYQDRTLIIEDSWELSYKRPRLYKNLKYHDLINILAFLRSKTSKINSKDKIAIQKLLSHLKTQYGKNISDSLLTNIYKILIRVSLSLPILHQLYLKLFRQLNPKIIFLEDGSYGNRSYIFKWAKDAGIKTGEFQHGLISKNMAAYNYSDFLFNTDYNSYLPDFLLTFGSYWGELIRTPSEVISIGNPYLSKCSAELKPESSSLKEKEILLVSSGAMPTELSNLALEIRNKLDLRKYKISIRPHPLEFLSLTPRYNWLQNSGIILDKGNLYDALKRVDYVIGLEPTTVLFEAIAFGKQIYTPKFSTETYLSFHLDVNIFSYFTSIDDLSQQITGDHKKDYQAEYFWDNNWRENYRNFVDQNKILS